MMKVCEDWARVAQFHRERRSALDQHAVFFVQYGTLCTHHNHTVILICIKDALDLAGYQVEFVDPAWSTQIQGSHLASVSYV